MLQLRLRTAALATLLSAVPACFSPSGAGATATSTGDSTGDSTATTTTDSSTSTPTSSTESTSTSPTSTSTSDPTSTSTSTSTTTPVTSTTTEPTTESSTDSTSTDSTSTDSTSTTDTGSTTQTSVCGNGSIEPGEACDDGNANNDDACTDLCQPPKCGDAILHQGEQCDDGNGVNEDSCTNLCQLAACGDDFQQPGEQCDDGNAVDGDGCSASCQLEAAAVCGNGLVEPGEECETEMKGCDVGTCKWTYRIVFVTSVAIAGFDIGGFSGADSICNELAEVNDALTGRNFRAWLSGGTDMNPVHAISRIGVSNVPYQRLDGKVVANNTADFVDISDFMAPIDMDEKGVTIPDVNPVWTGTLNNGMKNPGDTQCGNWSQGGGVGRVGLKSALDFTWTDFSQQECEKSGHLYCINVVP